MFLGGLLIRVFKLEIVGMLRLNVGATLLSAVLGIAYLARCPEVNLAGHRVTYPGDRYTIDTDICLFIIFHKLFCSMMVAAYLKFNILHYIS